MTTNAKAPTFERKLMYAVLSLLATVIFTGGLCATGNFPMQKPFEILQTAGEIRHINVGVRLFLEKYHYLPGDLPKAGTLLPGCTGKDGSDCDPWPATAGDGIVGDPNFSKTWESPIKGRIVIPVNAPAGESALFWEHLCLSHFYCFPTFNGIKNGTPTLFSSSSPAAPFFFRTVGFIVGYADGSPLPKEFFPKGKEIKGIVLVLESWQILHGYYAMNEPGQQALSPLEAGGLDRTLDDGRPGSGYVRGYGAPSCFTADGMYYSGLNERDCGLVIKIVDSPKDVKNP